MIPRSASHPRPNNEPYYIDKHCPRCGEKLVLRDLLEDPNTPMDEVWHDEFICPNNDGGIIMDWPESMRDHYVQNLGDAIKRALEDTHGKN